MLISLFKEETTISRISLSCSVFKRQKNGVIVLALGKLARRPCQNLYRQRLHLLVVVFCSQTMCDKELS